MGAVLAVGARQTGFRILRGSWKSRLSSTNSAFSDDPTLHVERTTKAEFSEGLCRARDYQPGGMCLFIEAQRASMLLDLGSWKAAAHLANLQL